MAEQTSGVSGPAGENWGMPPTPAMLPLDPSPDLDRLNAVLVWLQDETVPKSDRDTALRAIRKRRRRMERNQRLATGET